MANGNGNTSSNAIASPWKQGDNGQQRDFSAVRALPYEHKLRETLGSLSGVVRMAGDEFTATILDNRAEELSYSWARLAKENPQVERVVKMLTEGSTWGETVMLTVSVTVPILWRYGFLPDVVGQPLAMANGVMPVTRSEERAAKQQQAAEEQRAQAAPQTASAEDTGAEQKKTAGAGSGQ